MNSRVFAVLVLCGLWATSHSLLLEAGAIAGVTALTVGGVTIAAPAAAALGLGALAVLKGVLIKKHLHRRQGRDVGTMEEEQNMAMEVEVAQRMDSSGCVAKLLCEIESMSAEELSPAMSSFKNAFEGNMNLEGARGVYDLAMSFGSKFAKVDSNACSRLFDKCVLEREDLAAMLDTTFSC